jgi:hypothetical protein
VEGGRKGQRAAVGAAVKQASSGSCEVRDGGLWAEGEQAQTVNRGVTRGLPLAHTQIQLEPQCALRQVMHQLLWHMGAGITNTWGCFHHTRLLKSAGSSPAADGVVLAITNHIET